MPDICLLPCRIDGLSIKLPLIALSVLILLASVESTTSIAQELPPGVTLSPEQMKKFREMRGRRGGRPQRSPPVAKVEEEKKPEKKEEEKKEGDDKKKEEEIKTVKRPTDGSGKLDPNRVRLQPDANGLVQFNYNSHPWADVLQEFADAAKFSFDWQELPADSLNLVTRRKYTLAQARDLLNRHLLARGFTLVVQGEVLTAVKIEKLDPSLVPRVEADDLEDYPPHDFVRVRFQLPASMDPAKAKDDVLVLLSPNAKVTPLLNTKRLLVIDSVANLRSVRDLIYAEQSAADSIIKPQIYDIRYRRADYVADQVMIVLGMDPGSRKSPQELQLETQRMQLFMQMQKSGKDVSKLVQKDGPPVHIAVDRQQNTLLINAPSDLMPTIERTIRQFDQPIGSDMAADLGGRSTRAHKTTTASTDAVVSALTEFGQLDPLTRLQSDSKTKTIFAYATEADHQKIEQMITKLDSSGREFYVIQLRYQTARGVAGTLMTMLVGPEKKKEDRGRSRYSFYGRSDDNEEKEEVGFKAMPDVEKNRLILWANADELTKVRKMLVDLGETPSGEIRNSSKVRVLKARTPEETARLLERLKAAYPGKLNIDAPASEPKAKKPEPAPNEDKVAQRSRLGTGRFMTVQLATPAAGEPKDATAEVPEVNIVVADDGRIVISSDDPTALNDFEDLMRTLEPPRQEFDIFRLQHVSSSYAVEKLEEYFAEELKDQTESVFDVWGEKTGSKAKDLGPATLGRRELLRFVSDRYKNTVIVQGASASQLTVTKQLIDIYDQPPTPKDYLSRKTAVIKLKYSRAQDIAKSLKEVYRELLSSKDKEFQDEEGRGMSLLNDERPYVFGEVKKNEAGEDDPVIISFDGVLSVGVDDVSNTLIVSARAEVLEDIKTTVKLLDQAAIPDTTIHVHRVSGPLSAEELQDTLEDSVGRPWRGGKPLQDASRSSGSSRGNDRRDGRDREYSRDGRDRRGR